MKSTSCGKHTELVAHDLARDQHDGRAIAVGFEKTVDEVEAAGSTGVGAGRQLPGQHGVRPGSSLLPRLPEIFDVSFDKILTGQPAPDRLGKRGLPSQLAQQLDALGQLPKARQKVVYDVLSAIILVQAQVERHDAG